MNGSKSRTHTDGMTTRRPHQIRMRTIVAGLIALTISISVLISTLTVVSLPGKALALGVLIGAGLLLLGNGVATAAREQRARAVADDPHLAPDQPANPS